MVGGDYEVWAAKDKVPCLVEAVRHSEAFPFNGVISCLCIVKESGPDQGQVPPDPAACGSFTGARAVFLEEEKPDAYPREVWCETRCPVEFEVFHTLFDMVDNDLLGLEKEVSKLRCPHELVLGAEQVAEWSHYISSGEGPGSLLHQTKPASCIGDSLGLREILDGVDNFLRGFDAVTCDQEAGKFYHILAELKFVWVKDDPMSGTGVQ